ncbi:MAG TPA: GAF domain-containing protein [Thermoanaerobaculia bacterium]|nr:GAF domain-containing protein [Thermoanaerobaculia bacterium]
MAYEPESSSSRAEVSALAELALCENLAQTSGWAAKWSAQVAEADGATLWAPDTVHPVFLCIAAEGEGTRPFLKRSANRETGVVHDLIRDKRPITYERKDFSATDPWFKGMPAAIQACMAIPLEAEGIQVGMLGLLFHQVPRADQKVAKLKSFLQHAAPALARALRSDRKTVGMLHAIERLTNLYDLSKAFSATIDLGELNQIIIRKAVDFGVAEVGSLWLLESETSDVILAGTAVNENYEVENVPDAVGASVVGNLLVSQKVVRDNSVSPTSGIATENEGYLVRSVIAFPLMEDQKPVGVLLLVNKRGRIPQFSAEDQELLQDLCRQAVRALRNARQYEAERKVEELDALLAVSREITSTLDIDKVMQTVVNASAALISYDQSAIAIMDKGRLRLGAISGKVTIDRHDPKTKAIEELLEWTYSSGSDVAVAQDDDGKVQTDRPETEEKFLAFFKETGFRSFHGLLLNDDEGQLGVLAFFRKRPMFLEEDKGDLLAILVNQATVAVRNAQLYKQVVLPGFLKPLAERRRQFLGIPRRRRLAYGTAALLLVLLLVAVPWRIRIEGPARVLPARRAAVTAGVEGTVNSVVKHEGDTVAPGDVIATLDPGVYQAALADARAAYAIAASDVARFQEAADSAQMFEARSKRDELRARIALEEDRVARTTLRAPTAGVIVTPRIEERVGQYMTKGTELCVVADAGRVLAEVGVPESEVSLIKTGQPVSLKLNPFPTRTFRGTLVRPGTHVREEGEDHFVVAEVEVADHANLLKTGMQGKAKVATSRVPLGIALFRKPVRYLWNKVWPILP